MEKLVEMYRSAEKEIIFSANGTASEEGLFVGISTGAVIAGVSQIIKQVKGKRILVFAYDTGERYLTVDGLF